MKIWTRLLPGSRWCGHPKGVPEARLAMKIWTQLFPGSHWWGRPKGVPEARLAMKMGPPLLLKWRQVNGGYRADLLGVARFQTSRGRYSAGNRRLPVLPACAG